MAKVSHSNTRIKPLELVSAEENFPNVSSRDTGYGQGVAGGAQIAKELHSPNSHLNGVALMQEASKEIPRADTLPWQERDRFETQSALKSHYTLSICEGDEPQLASRGTRNARNKDVRCCEASFSFGSM
jgi:hypothetical protein